MSDEKGNKTSSDDKVFDLNLMIIDLNEHVLSIEQAKDSTEIQGALKLLEEGLISLKSQVGDDALLDSRFAQDIKNLEFELSHGKKKLASLLSAEMPEEGEVSEVSSLDAEGQLEIDRALEFSPEEQEFLDAATAGRLVRDNEAPPASQVPAETVEGADEAPEVPTETARVVDETPEVSAKSTDAPAAAPVVSSESTEVPEADTTPSVAPPEEVSMARRPVPPVGPPPRPPEKPPKLSPQAFAEMAAKRMKVLIDVSGAGNIEIQQEIKKLFDAGNTAGLNNLLRDINHELKKAKQEESSSLLETLNTKNSEKMPNKVSEAMPMIFDQAKDALNREKINNNTETLQRMRLEIIAAMMKYVLDNPKLDEKKRDLIIGAICANGSKEDRKILQAAGMPVPVLESLKDAPDKLVGDVSKAAEIAGGVVGGLFKAVANVVGYPAGQSAKDVNETERANVPEGSNLAGQAEKDFINTEREKALAGINSDLNNMPKLNDDNTQLIDFSFLHDVNPENIKPILEEFEKRSEGSDALRGHFAALKNLDERSHEDLVTIAASLEFVSDFIFHVRNILDNYSDDLSSSQKMVAYRQLQLKSYALMQAQEKLVKAMIDRLELLEPGVLENLTGGDYDRKYLCEYREKNADEKVQVGMRKLFEKARKGNVAARDLLSVLKHINGSDIIKYLAYIGKYGSPEQANKLFMSLSDTVEADNEKIDQWLVRKVSQVKPKLSQEGFRAVYDFIINNKKIFQDGKGEDKPLVIRETEFLNLCRLMDPMLSMVDAVRMGAEKKFFENRDEFRQFCTIAEKFSKLGVGEEGVIGWAFESFVRKCQNKKEFLVCAGFVDKCKTTKEFGELVEKYKALNQEGVKLYAKLASQFEGVSDVSELMGLIQNLQGDKVRLDVMNKILGKLEGNISYDQFKMIAGSLEEGKKPLFLEICLREADSIESYNSKIQQVNALVADSPALKALGRISDVKVLSFLLGISEKDLMSVLRKVKETLGDDGIKHVDNMFNKLRDKKLIQLDNDESANKAAFLVIAIVKNAKDVVETLPSYQENRGAMLKICFDALSDSIKKFSAQFPEAREVLSELLEEFCIDVDINSIVKKINDPEGNVQHTEVVALFVSAIGKLGSFEREYQDVIDEAFSFAENFFPQKDKEHEAALASMMVRYKEVVKFSSDDYNAYINAVKLAEDFLERPTPEFNAEQEKDLGGKVCVELLARKKQAGFKLPRSKMMEVALDLARQYRSAKKDKSEIIEQVRQFKKELELMGKFLNKENNPNHSAELEKVKVGVDRIIERHEKKVDALPEKMLRIFKRPRENENQKQVAQDGILGRFKRKRSSSNVSDRETASHEEGVSKEVEGAAKKIKNEKHPLKRRRLIAKRSGKNSDGGATSSPDGPGSTVKK